MMSHFKINILLVFQISITENVIVSFMFGLKSKHKFYEYYKYLEFTLFRNVNSEL